MPDTKRNQGSKSSGNNQGQGQGRKGSRASAKNEGKSSTSQGSRSSTQGTKNHQGGH